MVFYITKVHYDENYKNNEVIANLMVSCEDDPTREKEYTKNEIIRVINDYKYEFYTYYKEGVGDHVHVVDNKYLRTDGNNIKCDNLGNLPRY